MVARKSLLGPKPEHPELDELFERTRELAVTDEQLEEQRISFAYGNAPSGSRVTKESLRSASQRMQIVRDR